IAGIRKSVDAVATKKHDKKEDKKQPAKPAAIPADIFEKLFAMVNAGDYDRERVALVAEAATRVYFTSAQAATLPPAFDYDDGRGPGGHMAGAMVVVYGAAWALRGVIELARPTSARFETAGGRAPPPARAVRRGGRLHRRCGVPNARVPCRSTPAPCPRRRRA